MTYRADIDGLRCLAVLLVVVFHFQLVGLSDVGFIGVDIFFVISGYLITRIQWSALDRGTFSLSHFYAQRIRRLAPALLLVQIATMVLAAVFLMPNETVALGKEILAAQLYASNVFYWRTLNYFGVLSGSAAMLHTWSLAVEEQFYLVFPLVLLAIHRKARARSVTVLAWLVAGSFLLNLVMVGLKPEATFYLLPTRAWELLIGGVLARLEPRLILPRGVRSAAGPFAILLIAAAFVVHTPLTPFPGWFALFPVTAAVLLILAGSGAEGERSGSWISGWLGHQAPVAIGRMSYPLYLVHWPINVLAATLLPAYGLRERWGMFALSLACAWMIHWCVERPVQRKASKTTDGVVYLVYAFATFAVCAASASMWLSGGWRARFSPAVLKVADVAGAFDARQVDLDYRGGALDPSLRPIGVAGAPPRWLIWGDSHAGALADATSVWLRRRNEAGVLAFQHGCMPLLDTGAAQCRQFNRAVFRYLGEHPEISQVVMISIWRQPLGEDFTDAAGRLAAGPAAAGVFEQALRKTLTRLNKLGVRAYVWEPLPALPGNVPTRQARNMVFGPHWPVTLAEPEHRATFRFMEQALDRAGPLIAGRIDPAETLCRSGQCVSSEKGLPLYLDNNHPAPGQAPFFSDILERGVSDRTRR